MTYEKLVNRTDPGHNPCLVVPAGRIVPLEYMAGDTKIDTEVKTVTAIIKFNISGSLRFLSHAETVRFFQRTVSRAKLNVVYSRGFNPRQKISLPLPRTVGIESEGDLLCLGIEPASIDRISGQMESQIEEKLSDQLPPEGCEITSVELKNRKISISPIAATYLFPLKTSQITEQLTGRIEHLLNAETLKIIRQKGPKDKNPRNIDVRGFIQTIEPSENALSVECRISQAGSIRVDEILTLLELNQENLSGPIKRTNVQWKII